jgi:hypothetical protein
MVESSQNLDDIDDLLNDLLPFAEKMLRKAREFLPFGAITKPDGQIVWEGAYDGDDLPLSQDLIDILNESHKRMADGHELRACAVVYDIRTTPPGKSKKQDAICVSVDHINGYSAQLIHPYKFSLLGRLVVEDGYAIRGESAIFSRTNA